MDSAVKKRSVEYSGIFLMSLLSGFLVSLCGFWVLIPLGFILFTAISFKYFNNVLLLLIFYIPFQIAFNVSSDIDLASGRVSILYLFGVWLFKSLAEKKVKINFSLQTIIISLFLFIAVFSITQAWDTERAFRKILVFFSIFPLYFIITSLGKEGEQALVRLRGSAARNKNNYIRKILNTLFVSGFILSFIGIIQFSLQFFAGIDPIMEFYGKVIAPTFYGRVFGAEVVSNPSWLVNIGGITVMRAISLFPDPHMFSFYLGLLIPIVLAIVLIGKNNFACHPELVSGSLDIKGLTCFQFAIQIAKRIGNICGYKQKILKQVQNDRNDNGHKNGKFIVQGNKTLYFILATMFLAELLTFSRGGYLGMIAGVGAVIILGWRYLSFYKKVFLGFLFFVFLAIILNTNSSITNRFFSSFDFNEGSNTERIKNWSQGWEIFSDNLLFGVGIGNYSLAINPTADYRAPIYAHNLYLDIAAEMGVFALIVWLALITITIYQLFKLSRNTDNSFVKSVSVGFIGSFVWLSVHGFFDTPIYSPTILAMFMVILSLSAMILEKRKEILMAKTF